MIATVSAPLWYMYQRPHAIYYTVQTLLKELAALLTQHTELLKYYKYSTCNIRVLAKAIKGGGPPILLMLTAPIQLLSAPFQLPPALLLHAHARSVRLREFTVPRTRTPCDCVYQRYVAAVASSARALQRWWELRLRSLKAMRN